MADTYLTPPSFRTLRYILDKARVRFGQSDPRLENQIVPEITDRLREICAEYPYWFLTIEPTLPPFPVDSLLIVPQWLRRGWYLTGTGANQLYLESSINQDPYDLTLFHITECRKLNFIKVYDINGAFLLDMDIQGPDAYWSGAWVQQPDTGANQGTPRIARPHTYTVGGGSSVNFAPQCDKPYVFCISWDMTYPAWFQHGNSVTSLLLLHYPRLIEQLVYIQYAEFFKEWEIKERCEKEIWGDARGRIAASIPNWGIIGAMKLDTISRFQQSTPELEWHQSARDAVGRNGGYHRSASDPYYYGPTPY